MLAVLSWSLYPSSSRSVWSMGGAPEWLLDNEWASTECVSQAGQVEVRFQWAELRRKWEASEPTDTLAKMGPNMVVC